MEHLTRFFEVFVFLSLSGVFSGGVLVGSLVSWVVNRKTLKGHKAMLEVWAQNDSAVTRATALSQMALAERRLSQKFFELSMISTGRAPVTNLEEDPSVN